MPREGRSLIIHCSGPALIAPGTVVDGAAGQAEVRLWSASLDAHRDRIPIYAAVLDPTEQERAARFRFAVDRERFIIAHGLLRTLLGQHLGMRPDELRFARGPYGKPYVEGSDLHFNLSDTKDALLIGLAQGMEIGVDIETMARKVDHLAVGEHYFTPEEIRSIRGSTVDPEISSGTVDPPGRPPSASDAYAKRRFLELWTRKEAVLKASGVGIMDDLRVLRVDGTVNRMTISHEAFIAHAAPEYHLRTWHLGSDHILSIASDAPLGMVMLEAI